MLGVRATPERVAQIGQELGLHRPLLVQYVEWLGGVVTGDLGNPYSFSRPVAPLLYDRFFVSLELVLLTLLVSIGVAVPLGVLAALRKNT